MLTTYILSKRSKLRSRLLLLPLLPNEVSTKLCITYEIESVKQALLDVRTFATMMAMSEDISHKYMFGLNITTLIFKK